MQAGIKVEGVSSQTGPAEYPLAAVLKMSDYIEKPICGSRAGTDPAGLADPKIPPCSRGLSGRSTRGHSFRPAGSSNIPFAHTGAVGPEATVSAYYSVINGEDRKPTFDAPASGKQFTLSLWDRLGH